jgi:hypothetical protein
MHNKINNSISVYDTYLNEFIFLLIYLLDKFSGDEYIRMVSSVDKELLSKLQNLSLVTWTANELISIITSNYEG